MKILYFSRDYTTHDRRFLLKLADSNHEICYLRLENDSITYEQNPLPSNVELVEWPIVSGHLHNPKDCIDKIADLEAVLHQIKPDLIHAGPVLTCGFMTALIDFHPFLLMSWGSDILVDAYRNPTYQWVSRYTLQSADYFLTDCDAVNETSRRIAPQAHFQTIKFPWGLDWKTVPNLEKDNTLRCNLGWDDCFILISVRTWEPDYRIATLVEAFAKSFKSNPNIRLFLLGDGSCASEIMQTIKDYQLTEYIHTPGRMDQDTVYNYFRNADLYVSCSVSDGTSISLLEAMAFGLPAIVTESGGNSEWISNEDNGWLVDTGNPNELSQALLKASKLNEQEYLQISKNNQSIVTSRADWNENVQQLLKVYDEIASKSN